MINGKDCGSCKWWNESQAEMRTRSGRCHRNPPVLIRSEGFTVSDKPAAFFGWPTTLVTHGCGEHSDWSAT